MIYKKNEDLKNEIKKILKKENLTFTDVANKLNISRQQLNNYFNKKNFSFKDLKNICDVINYKIIIEIKKIEE